MTKLVLLACGSRTWGIVPTNLPAVEYQAAVLRARAERDRTYREIAALAPTELIHGAANGADRIAAECFIDWTLAEERGGICTPFPADWRALGKRAGHVRNEKMLREGRPDRGLAFGALWWLWTKETSLGVVAAQQRRTGTGDMVQRMLRARLPVRWIETADAPAVDLTEMPEPSR